jgi:hypothetical protein
MAFYFNLMMARARSIADKKAVCKQLQGHFKNLSGFRVYLFFNYNYGSITITTARRQMKGYAII